MAGNLAGKPIAMLGCDQREVDLAIALIGLGADLRLVGFPQVPSLKRALHFQVPAEAVRGARAVIAPMSNTNMEGAITDRLDGSDEAIDLTELIPLMSSGTPLLIGVAKPVVRGLSTKYGLRLVEIAEIDELAILNSIPTAEGALQLAMENTSITIHNSRCLVLGLGRCGTTIAHMLLALGAKVTVASRSGVELARAAVFGAERLELDKLHAAVDFDVIFNTIPAMVLPLSYLRLLKSNTVIIDIAASPGGTDFAAAEELGIKAIHALSLPGRVAPQTAGEILVRTIPRLLENLLGEEHHET